jgi:Tfp pilus assembly protein PilN
MRVINFLPDDYLKRRSNRKANFLCLAIAGGTLLLLGLVAGGMFVRSLGVARMRAVVETQYADASRQINDLKELETRKDGLLHKVDLSTALLERVPRSTILARLTNHLPQNTSLTAMQMQVTYVEVASKTPDPAAAPAAVKGKKGSPKTAKTPTVKVPRLGFRLDGLAKTDVEVAEFLTHLGADPLFDEINLQFSEAFPYQEGMTMRRFQLCFNLSSNAEKVLEGAETAPAATVDAGPEAAAVQPHGKG